MTFTVPAPERRWNRSLGSAVEPAATEDELLHNKRSDPAARVVGRVGRSAGAPGGVAGLSKGSGEVGATGVPARGVVAHGRRPALSPSPALSTGLVGFAVAGATATLDEASMARRLFAPRVVPLGPIPGRAPRPVVGVPSGPMALEADSPTEHRQLFYLVPAHRAGSAAAVAGEGSTPPAGGDEPCTPSVPHLLLTIQEVAATLRCGRTCVYDLIGRGELPAIKLGRLTRIPAAALRDLVARRLEHRIDAVDADVARWAATMPRGVRTLA
jgi:excisionase family DNA binding protein